MPGLSAEHELSNNVLDIYEAEDPDDEGSDVGDAEREVEEETAKKGADADEENPPPKEEKADDADSNDDAMTQKVLDDRKALKDEDASENPNRRKAIIGGLLLLMILIFLIILGVVFGLDQTPASTVLITDTPAPTASTESPTVSPTKEGETFPPTLAPTNPLPTPNPTPFPGIPVFPEVSELPCDLIRQEDEVTGPNNDFTGNFKTTTVGGKVICGDTYGGPDPERPNRSFWSVSPGRRDCPLENVVTMNEICLRVGARLCTEPELRGEVAQGSGCGGDRGFVWTRSSCSTNGDSGFLMFDFGLRDSKGETTCETNLENKSVVRCCGDNF